jgi:hypothetical protein
MRAALDAFVAAWRTQDLDAISAMAAGDGILADIQEYQPGPGVPYACDTLSPEGLRCYMDVEIPPDGDPYLIAVMSAARDAAGDIKVDWGIADTH